MLFKLSINSIKKSLRDYAIYFFTLVIGVSIFYVFNAIGDQVAFLDIGKGAKDIADMLTDIISIVSIFVAIALGLLIVQSNRFIMKRRNKEFALYMTLGMSKSKISIILFLETIMIGISSIALGLIIGIGLSQLMSALIINLFEANISQYQFTISGAAIGKTILYFVIIYLVVMIFNNFIIGRFKIINLMHSSKKSEKVKLKNPILCTIIFILAAIALTYAYYQVGWTDIGHNAYFSFLLTLIFIGTVSTFLIFWSISGLIFRIMSVRKKKYYKGLNSFTFRQVSSKINTMVLSMTSICLMLFVTICTISSGFAVKDSLNEYYNELYPTDFLLAIEPYKFSTDENSPDVTKPDNTKINIVSHLKKNGIDILKYFKEYMLINTYTDDRLDDFIRISDYNKAMDFFGRERLSLNDNEFIKLYNTKDTKDTRDKDLHYNKEITVNDHKLVSRYDECKYGGPLSWYSGYVVPDSVIDNSLENRFYLIGNYNNNFNPEAPFYDETFFKSFSDLHTSYTMLIRENIEKNLVKTVATLLCLYIGFVFLIACGTTLALKELSDISDSSDRYKILRKIGADEKDISRSIFRQIGFFFLLPLLIACVHSIFGMKFVLNLLQIVSLPNLISSVSLNAVIIILIYGGYFLITYRCCKNMIKNKK